VHKKCGWLKPFDINHHGSWPPLANVRTTEPIAEGKRGGMEALVRKQGVAVYGLTAFIGLQVVFASSSVLLGLPFLTYQPPHWRTLLIYGGGAAYVTY
jgi:hypothetical protein